MNGELEQDREVEQQLYQVEDMHQAWRSCSSYQMRRGISGISVPAVIYDCSMASVMPGSASSVTNGTAQ